MSLFAGLEGDKWDIRLIMKAAQSIMTLRWLGICDFPAYIGEPPCNGCAGRFVRTLKEQCIWSRPWRDVEELR